MNNALGINMLHYINAHPKIYDGTYEVYQLGKLTPFSTLELSSQEREEIKVLSLLEKLGFPMEQTGTYLFKEMVMKAVSELQEVTSWQEKERIKQEMEFPFSQFYVDVARNNMDMGIKTFHYVINLSYTQTNISKFNQTNMRKKGIDLTNPNYQQQAYKIAEHIVLERKKESSDSHQNIHQLVKNKI